MKKLSTFEDNQTILVKRDVLAKFNVDLSQVFLLSDKSLKNLNKFLDGMDDKHLSVIQLSLDHDLHRDILYQKHNRKTYEEKNLPFHLDDRTWVIDYITQYIMRADNLKKFTQEEIKKHLETSPELNQMLVDYEKLIMQKIIKTTEVADLNQEQRTYVQQSNSVYRFEDVFRSKALFNMDILGISRDKAELTLEKNANLWLQKNMLRTFMEHYYRPEKQPNNLVDLEHWEHLKRVHADRWLKYNEYTYYRKHQKVIDEAGTATKNMLMSSQDMGVVSHGLCQCNDLHREIIINDFEPSCFEDIEQDIRSIF